MAALGAETMEAEYFEAIEGHCAGTLPHRSVDLFPQFFAQVVDAISETDDDVLGDLFQGGISYGENGLYLTPRPVAELMARTTIPDDYDEKKPLMISDPCCGTGILLIEAGKLAPNSELVGQDIDPRCARITALNLGLRGKYGWVICGNTLSRDVQFVYRIADFIHEGPNGFRRGVIRSIPPEECPVLPELRKQLREDLFEAVEAEDQPETDRDQHALELVEVPQWLARLERLFVLEKAEVDEKEEEAQIIPRKVESTQQFPKAKEGPLSQQELF
ncbi:N-6 DNA methylase [Calycomorphotria hydatis]|uniref:site-specific DNA-methyltransferase (adenine-specific) n=1 Tax=Calycomorphotria hydatis TaxID=2528027 RepID=A0A517T6R8_9PLAN|nr:N-6 DNA methylase [Calycomorphotria hydatis]QDT64075.1 Restriction enzyme BgcI subunit alpha [Calycomorphotria hydatis]